MSKNIRRFYFKCLYYIYINKMYPILLGITSVSIVVAFHMNYYYYEKCTLSQNPLYNGVFDDYLDSINK